MDSAYEGQATRELAQQLGFVPVVPPNPRRKQPWVLNKRSYRRRNEVERLFRRLKAWRRVFTRYDKLDVMFGERFDPAPSDEVVGCLAELAPREMRRAWMTAFGNARLEARSTLQVKDLPANLRGGGGRRAPIGFMH
jgi:hypothetical protein